MFRAHSAHHLDVNQISRSTYYYVGRCGFGGLEVVCWPLVPKFAGSHPAKTVGFLGQKNPQHAFLQKGSKAVGLMS
jgi:hypothetical protein